LRKKPTKASFSLTRNIKLKSIGLYDETETKETEKQTNIKQKYATIYVK